MTAKRADSNGTSDRLRPPGPIAQKIIASIEKLKRQKVIDLAAWRKGEEDARRVYEGAAPSARAATVDRTTKRTNAADGRTGYQTLMKRGLDERYWVEYVFEGYAGYEAQVIFVEGLPDVPESRPHSPVNSRRF